MKILVDMNLSHHRQIPRPSKPAGRYAVHDRPRYPLPNLLAAYQTANPDGYRDCPLKPIATIFYLVNCGVGIYR
jgi:hypothetical protein